MPAMKKARIGLSSTGSNSAPSTPPRVKFEEPLSKLGVRKTPTQHQQQQQEEPQTRPKSLWSFARNTKVEQDTSLINPRQVDEEVHSTFSQSTWSDPPPLHHIRVALQYLKFNALKPDSVITSGLLRLAKAMPDLFREHTISSMMIQMLRPDFTHSFKIRTNGAVVYLVCTLLHIAWDDIEDWPTDFVMAYLEDALGERSWCAIAETKQFVGNILTAFRIDDVSEDSGDDRFDPVRLDEKSSTSAVMATIDFQQYTGDLSLRKRYRDPTTRSNIKYFTLQTMWEHLPMCLGASAVDVSVRSLIKVMVITCRWVEVRMRAMGCMEFWLGSFMKSAKPLLRVVLRHISSQEMLSPEDLETWTMLLDFRYKGRSHQVEAVKEELRVAFLGLSGQVLIRSGLKHIMAMELNPNELKNPYHMDLMELLLQGISEKPAVVFGQLIRGYVVESAIQMTGTMLSPPLAPVVLVVKRWIRHLGKRSTGWNADVIIGLLQEGPHFSELAQKQEQHPGLVGRNPSVIWLQMMSEIICSVMLAAAIDAKESEEIKMSKFSISHAHAFVLQWIHAMIEQNDGAENETCRTPFGIVPLEVVRICIGRILYLDPPPSYALDSTSQEFDMALILRVIENGLPLTEQGLTALLDIRLPPKMLLAIVGDYIS
ncbi:Integrator complex subunit 1, partial [Lunasporangiospora selenospora]